MRFRALFKKPQEDYVVGANDQAAAMSKGILGRKCIAIQRIEGCVERFDNDSAVYVDGAATLEAAMPIFEQSAAQFIPVVTLSAHAPPELLGALFHVDALKAYNHALAATAAEEHS